MDKNLIIAHRGIFNNTTIPENSIKAFKKAVKLGYAIELDLEMTKDNVLIVFHDSNLKRMTCIDKYVKDVTYNEIKNVYLLNTKETIPTLEDVLKIVDNKVLLNIEIKKDIRYKTIIDNLSKLLNKYNSYSIIQSFDYKAIYYINKHYNNYKKGILISDKSKKNNLYQKIMFKLCNIDFISISKSLINSKKYQKYYNKYSILIWTFKSSEELNKYKNKYYGYICDNLPY